MSDEKKTTETTEENNLETPTPTTDAPVEQKAETPAPAPTETPAPAPAPAPAETTTVEIKKSIIPAELLTKQNMIIAGAVALLLVILLVFTGGRSPEATINQYAKAFCAADSKEMLKLFPTKLTKELDKDDDAERMYELLDSALSSSARSVASRIDVSSKDLSKYYTIYIDDVTDVTGSSFRSVQDKYDDLDLNVKDVCVVEFEIEFSNDGEKYRMSDKIQLIKVGSSWYFDISELYSMMW